MKKILVVAIALIIAACTMYQPKPENTELISATVYCADGTSYTEQFEDPSKDFLCDWKKLEFNY